MLIFYISNINLFDSTIKMVFVFKFWDCRTNRIFQCFKQSRFPTTILPHNHIEMRIEDEFFLRKTTKIPNLQFLYMHTTSVRKR